MIGQATTSMLCAVASFSMLSFTAADKVYSTIKPPAIEGKAFVKERAYVGELATVTWDVIKRTSCPGKSSRVWHGPDGYSLTEMQQATTLPVGAGTYKIPTRIPNTAPEGPLQLSISGYTECPGKPVEYWTLTPVVIDVARR